MPRCCMAMCIATDDSETMKQQPNLKRKTTMAHQVEQMAYIGHTPWHGLGTVLEQGESLDQWRIEAGLNWQVNESPALYDAEGETLEGEGKILYRSDNRAFLSHVSDRYQVVQPEQIVEFYRDLCESKGFVMDTMGSLRDGKRIWALARTGEGFTIGKNDQHNNYLLLATSFDKTMATRAMFTTVRVVCNNTLTFATEEKGGLSISHSTKFDETAVKVELGIETQQDHILLLQEATKMKVKKTSDAVKWIGKALFNETLEIDSGISTRKANIIQGVFDLYNGKGRGSSFETSSGTVYGLLQATTEYIDHQAGRNTDTRLNSAWFGNGARQKTRAITMIKQQAEGKLVAVA